MITISEDILRKHAVAIQAARNYWVLNLPTGMLDRDFNILEQKAREDGLELRDYVRQEIQGTRAMNADYITKVEKEQVPGDMYDAMLEFQNSHPEVEFWIPKYDGSSLAAYYNPETGRCFRVITIGGSNLCSEGIDQTAKFAKFFPDLPETGICAIQAECLVSLDHGFGESSRQKANGLVNSKFLENEVSMFCNIRAFRFYLDPNYKNSKIIQNQLTYQEVLNSFPEVKNITGDIKFSGGYVFSRNEVKPEYRDFLNHDIWKTPTGTFLVDGVVGYTKEGVCIKALKYKDAGRGESSEVLGIKWNNQASKGKDSWSANAIITPVIVRGSTITKPTVGSIGKMVKSGISKGAKVTVILANSTIPAIKDVIQPGNLDYEWPTCSCGHKMGPNDIFGALLKCGNPKCSERLERMKNYLSSISGFSEINLDKFLVIDRLKWNEKFNTSQILTDIEKIIRQNLGVNELGKYLSQFMSTPLQKRNLELVINPAYSALYGKINSK